MSEQGHLFSHGNGSPAPCRRWKVIGSWLLLVTEILRSLTGLCRIRKRQTALNSASVVTSYREILKRGGDSGVKGKLYHRKKG